MIGLLIAGNSGFLIFNHYCVETNQKALSIIADNDCGAGHSCSSENEIFHNKAKICEDSNCIIECKDISYLIKNCCTENSALLNLYDFALKNEKNREIVLSIPLISVLKQKIIIKDDKVENFDKSYQLELFDTPTKFIISFIRELSSSKNNDIPVIS